VKRDLTWTRGGAELSADGLYRFKLWRRWNGSRAVGRILAFVMLNPSTADEHTDDATIRRCIGFAKDLGFDGVDVVNLFARISTYPHELRAWSTTRTGDPRGREALLDVALGAARVVVAWGANGDDWPDRVDTVMADLRRCRVPLYSFAGATKGGQPLHPLRLSSTHPLELWAANDLHGAIAQ
jgi:hypothetical protein